MPFGKRKHNEHDDSASEMDSSGEENNGALSRKSESSDGTGSSDEVGRDEESNDEELFEFVDVSLNPLQNDVLRSAMIDNDAELWLVRIPRHSSLREDLLGSEIELPSEHLQASRSISGLKAGSFKGNYMYYDHGPTSTTGPRPVFVTGDGSGKAQVEIGRPIAKSVSVAFDIPLKDLSAAETLPRSYPRPPVGQKRRYNAVGSIRDGTPISSRKKVEPALVCDVHPLGESARISHGVDNTRAMMFDSVSSPAKADVKHQGGHPAKIAFAEKSLGGASGLLVAETKPSVIGEGHTFESPRRREKRKKRKSGQKTENVLATDPKPISPLQTSSSPKTKSGKKSGRKRKSLGHRDGKKKRKPFSEEPHVP